MKTTGMSNGNHRLPTGVCAGRGKLGGKRLALGKLIKFYGF